MNTNLQTQEKDKMSKKTKTVQEELELRRENKQDIHEWIKTQNQTKQKGENNE